ncbi:MAG: hypothetical protein HYS05_08770 [Acidobacteria bacterium]|nr:hypothetical protein [Acidobacteriota bacterium]
MKAPYVAFVCLCLCAVAFPVIPALGAAGGPTSGNQGAPPAGKPQTLAGLEMSVTAVERASSVSLQDCPPGANTQKGMTKPGEEFAVVTMKFKVLPAFKAGPTKRPSVKDAAGGDFYTAVSFVDVGKPPEFSCSFPFRTPTGTKLKSIQIDSLTFDLTPFEAKKPSFFGF